MKDRFDTLLSPTSSRRAGHCTTAFRADAPCEWGDLADPADQAPGAPASLARAVVDDWGEEDTWPFCSTSAQCVDGQLTLKTAGCPVNSVFSCVSLGSQPAQQAPEGPRRSPGSPPACSAAPALGRRLAFVAGAALAPRARRALPAAGAGHGGRCRDGGGVQAGGEERLSWWRLRDSSQAMSVHIHAYGIWLLSCDIWVLAC